MSGRQLRILHAPVNVAGAPLAFSRALQAVGCESRLLVFREQPFVRGFDENLDLPWGGGKTQIPVRIARQSAALFKRVGDYDVFHFHAGQSFMPRHVDLALLRRLGKGVAMTFWGSDIRDRPPEGFEYLRHAQVVIVGSMPTFKRAPRGAWPEYHVIPTAIDVSLWTPRPPVVEGRRVRIVHAPSRRADKGTSDVERAIAELERRGLAIEFDLVEGVRHEEARRRYEAADIIVDQLQMGWHGVFSLEGMALGKPVVAHIDPDARAASAEAFGIELPIVDASAESLADVLERLVREPAQLHELGRLGRAYVEQVHDLVPVGRRALEAYRAGGILPR